MNLSAPSKDKTEEVDSRLMGTGLIIGLILIGLFSFSALIGLTGYADELRSKNNGQAHALSNSAIGFAGLRTLLEESGQFLFLDPNEAAHSSLYDLRLYTLTSSFQTDVLDELNPQSPKLIILPKWNVVPVAKTAGWVRKAPIQEVLTPEILASNLKAFAGDISFTQAKDDNETLSKDYRFTLLPTKVDYSTRIPRLQTMEGEQLEPLIFTESDQIVLARVKNTQSYLLSDPDLLNTSGLKTRSGAKFAVDILGYLSDQNLTERYVFDLALHGIGGGRNMIKLFTQPPFLGVTLMLIIFMGLLAWQAFLRFGDAKRGSDEDFGEDFHMGPQSLTRTTAEFLAIAKREPSIAKDYATLVRQQALKALHLPGRDHKIRETALDRRETKKELDPTFAELKLQAQSAASRQDMLEVAKLLQDWKKEIIS
ncbi:hypothetical protein [Litorimonas sp.]|uniref:hypothetical protein n=1 Tax=Litorimonas sp. TaxID=1892381 RepID=UPI003A881CFE